MRLIAIIPFSLSLVLAGVVNAGELEDEILGYMDFATAAEGIILPEQLTEDLFYQILFVDTRSAQAYGEGTIPGAIHIEWREVPGRLSELPEQGTVVLFCDTGVRSSQATFAARVLGHTNVLVMQSGYLGWLQTAAYEPQ